jgi:hypothetical protein
MHLARRRLWTRLSSLAALTAALFPHAAQAEQIGPASAGSIGTFTGGAGAYLSFAFGEKLGVGYGVEAFGTFLLNHEPSCASGPRAGIGPMVQFGAVNWERPRLVVAAHGGGEPGSRMGPWIDGELGATFRFGKHRGTGLHAGLAVGTPYLAYGFGRAEFFLKEYSVGAGARVFTPFGLPGSCMVGRPLRDDGGMAATCGAIMGCQLGEPFDCESPEWVAQEWAQDAEFECASVAAFLQLAHELLMVNAPDHLIEEALIAAEQEIAHAALCAQVASRYAGRTVTPTLPAFSPRRPLGGEPGLVRLATESWLDGCVGEGAAAARAQVAARRGDGLLRRTHRRIERDERSHAALGWGVLSWALEVGGAQVRDAVRSARGVVPHEEERPQDRDAPADAAAHGRLSYDERQRIMVKHVNDSRVRLDRMVA